jgi:hypothetical protein
MPLIVVELLSSMEIETALCEMKTSSELKSGVIMKVNLLLSLVLVSLSSSAAYASPDTADVVATAGSIFEIVMDANAPVAQAKLRSGGSWSNLGTSDYSIIIFELPKGDSTVVFTGKYNPNEPFYNRISVTNVMKGTVNYVTSADIGVGNSTVITLYGQ